MGSQTDALSPWLWLGTFLRDHREAILRDWEAGFFESFPEWRGMSREAFRDSVPELLDDVVHAAQSASHGKITEISDEHAATHAQTRFEQNMPLREVVTEYGILRRVILTRLVEAGGRLGPGELVLLNEAIDMAVALVVHVYFEASRDKLQAGRRLLEGVLRQMPVGVLLVDASEKILIANDRARALFGCPDATTLAELHEIRGRRADGSAIQPAAWPFRRSLAGGEVVEAEELDLEREDGTTVSVRAYSSPVRDPEGAIQALVCLVEDVTEEHRAQAKREALEREIERRERLFRAVLDQLPAAVVIADSSGRVIRGAPQLEHILRRSLPSDDKTITYRGYDPDGRLYRDEELPLARSLATGEVVRGEVIELERGDGTRVPVRVSSAPVRDRNQATIAAVVMFEDLTERRRAEIELDRIWKLSRDPLCILGLDAFFKRVNPAFERTLGWTEEELRSSPVLEFVHPDDRSRTLAELRRLSQGVPTVRFENRYRRKDGMYCWMSWSSTPLPDEGVAYAVAHDITDQKRTEEAHLVLSYASIALNSTLEYQSTMANIARMAIPALADWCFVDMVGASGQLNRVEVAHADPRQAELAGRLRRVTSANPQSPIARALHGGRIVSLSEVTAATLADIAVDASNANDLRAVAPRSWVSVPLSIRGERLGVLTFIFAESGRRHRPEDFLLAEDLASRAAQAIDNARLYRESLEHLEFEKRLLGIVSHDLRNPLNVIQLASEALSLEVSGDPVRTQVARIASATQRATRLVKDLLDLTRVQLGSGIPVRPVPIDLREFVRAVLDEIQLIHETRKILFEAEGDVEGFWDRDRLTQVVINLVINALTYSPPSTDVTVHARDLGREVEIAVHNDGPAIPPDRLPLIFEPLQRGDPTSVEGGSLGLGLYIARQIVLAHKGVVTVRSTSTEGTTFTVRLPRSALERGEAPVFFPSPDTVH